MSDGPDYSASATFTPAAASHVAGDVVGGAKEFAFGAPSSGSRIIIKSARLQINGATIETTAWRLHLYSAAPATYADDAVWDIVTGDRSLYLGYIDLSQVLDFGTTLYIDMPNLNKAITLTGPSVFGYLVNGTTLTPQAVAHIVTLEAVAA